MNSLQKQHISEALKNTFQNGRVVWNKGKSSWAKGKHFSEKHKTNLAKSKYGDKNPIWKGDRVGYDALHAWIRRNKPKPEFCEVYSCKSVPKDLANISQRYLRDINDFQWLCRKHHMRADGRIYNLKQYCGDTSSIMK